LCTIVPTFLPKARILPHNLPLYRTGERIMRDWGWRGQRDLCSRRRPPPGGASSTGSRQPPRRATMSQPRLKASPRLTEKIDHLQGINQAKQDLLANATTPLRGEGGYCRSGTYNRDDATFAVGSLSGDERRAGKNQRGDIGRGVKGRAEVAVQDGRLGVSGRGGCRWPVRGRRPRGGRLGAGGQGVAG
jgi:hypothetical protein